MAQAKRYRVLTGLNYTPPGKKAERRAEPGVIVTDLPAASVGWLLEQGLIEQVGGDPS